MNIVMLITQVYSTNSFIVKESMYATLVVNYFVWCAFILEKTRIVMSNLRKVAVKQYFVKYIIIIHFW